MRDARPAAPADRGPFVVAGMHRSGTSLLASLVAAAGVDLGERLLPADANNPAGYFEDLAFVQLHGRMLAACTAEADGGHRDWGWTESEQFDGGRLATFREEGAALIRAHEAAGRPWGWKDPRTTLLLDFWQQQLPDARWLLIYRFPWDVAHSMQRLGADVFLEHPEYAYRIWAFYNRRLLDFHRRHREHTALVSVDALVRQPERLPPLLLERCGLRLDGTSFERLLDRSAFTSRGGSDPLIALAAAASPGCVELLAELDGVADLPAAGLWRSDPGTLRLARQPAAEPVALSIITPCFEHGEFLLEAVASAERSAPESSELVVVDDGSRQPRTRQVLAALADLGYRVLSFEHGGLAAARNAGVRASRGRYLLPLDADNRLRPGHAEAAIRILDAEPEVGVVYGDRLEFGKRSATVVVADFDLDRLLAANFIDACAVLRREVWSDCGGFDGAMPAWEDWEFWISAAEAGWRFRHLPGVAFEYRVRPTSLVTQCAHAAVGAPLRQYMIRKHRELFLTRLPGMLERAQELLAAALEERDRGRAEAEQARSRVTALAADIARLGAERDRLRAEKADLDGERDRLYAELAAWRRRLEFVEATAAWRLRGRLLSWRRWLENRLRA